MTNFEMFMNLVNTMKSSQGMYSRLANNLEELSEEEMESVKEYWNSLPQFKDTVDIVLHLEG